MNTNHLKRFAREARKKLISQVAAKLDYVLSMDSAELREKANALKKLQQAINTSSKEQVIDKVAYTWFNRLMALRFMDANDFQPIGIRVVTPKDGHTLPEILDEAKQWNIANELTVKPQHIYDLLDGKIPSTNAQNEAYKELLIGACNHLNKVFPFLFERINDYAELLLPDDLTSEFSIVQDMREGMTIEDCKEVEIIGWLYQFYISEWNEELISSKKKYSKSEIAPASQLFTPKWIVQYMVDNTLGQLWSEINPNTNITSELAFYIKPTYKDQLTKREPKSIEEIKFFEPCAGSGHILSYAFDVFYKIYEEQGYNPTEIPELILTKNLFGIDIDQRAAQLASFVLMMKAREKYRRFFRKQIVPNITFYQDFEGDEKLNNASVIGSLINIETNEIKVEENESEDLFSLRKSEAKIIYKLLGQRYDVVVTNPPYISSSRMEGSLKQYIEAKYPKTKSDLFATFVLRNLELCNVNGLTAYMTPFVWMFISSYEKLRKNIIDKHFINNLIQLEYSGFDGATVPICTFTLRKQPINNAKGSYIRLSDFKGAAVQAPKTLEAIQNPSCGWFYTAKQKDFEKISGSPIGYWANKSALLSFHKFKSLNENYTVKSGVMTGDDNRFLRYWYELRIHDIAYGKTNLNEIEFNLKKYLPMNKEEGFRKWSGRYKFVFRYDKGGQNFSIVDGLNYRLRDDKYYFEKGISWGDVTSSSTSFRWQEKGLVFSARAPMIITDKKFLIGLLNSNVVSYFQGILNPTLSFNLVDLERVPVDEKIELNSIVDNCISNSVNISSQEWNSNITSPGFQVTELIRINGQDIEESYDLYQQYWKNKFFQLHKNEEELNRQFIEIYGLQEELTPDVHLGDITILKEETKILNGELVFQAKEVFAQFVSYAVGCMFGRYSLDKEGLILANQGETLEDYMLNVNGEAAIPPSGGTRRVFLPDADNIIPILDDEWFEDDITARFYEFLKVSFGAKHFEKNLHFIEDALGKDTRKYFAKDFYTDHIKRYKKRPIYWMFSSPKNSFNVLIYMHRYNQDTLNEILNGYLKEFQEKLRTQMEQLEHIQNTGSAAEQTKASKEIDKIKLILLELKEYERDILFPLATERIKLDLDDGVLVNYNKFGTAIKAVPGLNDAKTKKKVKGFDWIDTSKII